MLLKALAIYLVIVFVLDFFISNIVFVILYNIVIFAVVMMRYAKKLDCPVLSGYKDKANHDDIV